MKGKRVKRVMRSTGVNENGVFWIFLLLLLLLLLSRFL